MTLPRISLELALYINLRTLVEILQNASVTRPILDIVPLGVIHLLTVAVCKSFRRGDGELDDYIVTYLPVFRLLANISNELDFVQTCHIYFVL